MQADFDKYGDDYTVTILEEIVDYNDRYKEFQWMEKYQSHIRGNGYNYKEPHFFNKPRIKHLITFNGITKPLAQWASEMNLPYETIHNRLFARGWSVEKALTTPRMNRGGRHDQKRT
jgi:hypothetical protein